MMWTHSQLIVTAFGFFLLEMVFIGILILKYSDEVEESLRSKEDDWYDWYQDITNLDRWMRGKRHE